MIPDQAMLAGTVRSFSEDVREKIASRLKDLAMSLEKAFGVSVGWKFIKGVPPAVVNRGVTELAFEAAQRVLEDENVHYLEPKMGGEDFAFFSRKIPATFMRIGCGNTAKGIIHTPHSSRFDVDETSLAVGVEVFTEVVRKYLC